MDLTGCLRCLCSDLDGPCSCLVLTCCQETHKSKKMIACAYKFLKAGLCKSKILKEHLSLIFIKLRDLFLDLSTDYKYLTVLSGCIFAYSLNMTVVPAVICNIILCNICSIDHRFCSKKVVCCKPCILILVLCLKSDGKIALLKVCFYSLKECKLFGCFLIHPCCLCNLGNSSLQNLKI